MTEDVTPESANSGSGEPAPAASPDPESTQATKRDWIVPAAGLAALILAVAFFGGGFALGRAAEDPDPGAARARFTVHIAPRNEAPQRFDFRDFDLRGPRGGFTDPDRRPFGNFDRIPDAALEQLCQFLDEGVIPEDAPFVDRLTDLCTGANA